MPNILKVATPVSGYENTVNKQNTTAPQEDIQIKNPINPDKVTRPDGRTESGGEQQFRQGISADSNYGNFVRSLRDAPILKEVMSKFLFTRMGSLVEAGVGAGTAAEINELFEMLEMGQEDMKAFLKNQMSGANRLQGKLFDMLREVMSQASTVELRTNVLDFLKKYNDLSSSKHLLNNINNYLEEIQGHMFRRDAQTLQKLSEKLLPYSQEGQAQNVETLKEEIIPMLGKYISETRDLGKIRDLINLLTYNTSRYENGTLDSVMQAFKRLSEFPTFRKVFDGMSEADFKNLLQNVDFDRAAGRSELGDTLLDIVKDGLKGSAGLENRENFMNIVRGMLVNESVYMPVLHAMLPMIVNGTPIYSEIWADPDEEGAGGGADGERKVKLLVKFDMKDVGFFDMMLYYGSGKMDMMLRYPESLADRESEIREGIVEILRKNQMEVNFLALEKGKESIPVSAAFPKIFERRNAVDVTI